MNQKICIINKCNNQHHAKGYCHKHYIKLQKYGNALYGKREMHGLSYISEYKIWKHMKDRCYNKNNKFYRCYGGRGITVCDKWKNSFLAFYTSMGKRSFSKATIDRIDNDGNYTPENCKWVTQAENNQHQSRTKLTMQKAEEIREKYKTGKISQRKLGTIYGIGQDSISLLINNKTWI